MTVVCAFTGPDALTQWSALADIETDTLTTSWRLVGNSARARLSITPITEGWMRWHHFSRASSTGSSTDNAFFALYQTDDFETINTSKCLFYMRHNTGGSTAIRSQILFVVPSLSEQYLYDVASNVDFRFDVEFLISATGYVRLYLNNTLVFDESGDTRFSAGTNEVRSLLFNGVSNVGIQNPRFKQIFVTDDVLEDVRDWVIEKKVLTQSGTNNWAGTPGDITTGNFAASPITTDTVGHIVDFDPADVTLPAGNTIKAVAISASSRKTASSTPTAIGYRVLNATLNTEVLSDSLGTDYAGNHVVMNDNPLISSPWTDTAFNDAAFRVRFQSKA